MAQSDVVLARARPRGRPAARATKFTRNRSLMVMLRATKFSTAVYTAVVQLRVCTAVL